MGGNALPARGLINTLGVYTHLRKVVQICIGKVDTVGSVDSPCCKVVSGSKCEHTQVAANVTAKLESDVAITNEILE